LPASCLRFWRKGWSKKHTKITENDTNILCQNTPPDIVTAIANGDHLYIFYGEYGYPGKYDPATYARHQDLGSGNNAQDWSKPALLTDKPGHIIWYPSLQPTEGRTIGRRARLFYKDMKGDSSTYLSEYIVEFSK